MALKAGYKLDGNSNDAVGSNNGSDTAITYGAGNGILVQGALFNGSSSVISVTDNAAIKNAKMSISFWVNLVVAPVGTILIDRMDGSGPTPYGWRIQQSSGILMWELYTSASQSLSSAVALSTGTWYHIVCTYDGVTQKIYKNNVLNASGAVANAGDIAYGGTTINLGMGARTSGSPAYTNTKLDEVFIFDREINTTEINSLYNGGAARNFPNTTTMVATVVAFTLTGIAVTFLKAIALAVGTFVLTGKAVRFWRTMASNPSVKHTASVTNVPKTNPQII